MSPASWPTEKFARHISLKVSWYAVMKRRSDIQETMLGEQRWVRWSLLFGFWTLLGVFFGIQLYLVNALEYRHPIPWRQAMFWALSDWYIWAALSPLVLWLARLFHLSRESWAQDLRVH